MNVRAQRLGHVEVDVVLHVVDEDLIRVVGDDRRGRAGQGRDDTGQRCRTDETNAAESVRGSRRVTLGGDKPARRTSGGSELKNLLALDARVRVLEQVRRKDARGVPQVLA